MSAPQANEAEKNIEIWKVKKLIKRLEQARGNGTSMISLIIRESTSPMLERIRVCADSLRGTAPKDQVSRAARMLAEEFVRSENVSADTFLINLGHCIQHQIPSQPIVGPVSHHIHSAASQALQQSTSQRSCRLLR